MPGLLQDEVVVVTGGASGIGRAVCHRSAKEGAKAVVCVDLRPEPPDDGPTTESLVREAGAAFTFARADVRVAADVEAAVAAADAHGGISVLVTCAGVLRIDPVLEEAEETFDLVVGINLKGTYLAALAAGRKMVADQRRGAIVTISSIAGIGGSSVGLAYTASKGGVRLMTYGLANALGEHGIRVNTVHPGLIPTSMTAGSTNEMVGWRPRLDATATADDVASAVVFLASPMAAYISGASLVVDGAQTSSI